MPGERVRGPQLPGHSRIHDWHFPFAKLPDNRETKRARGMASAHLALSRRSRFCQITEVIWEHLRGSGTKVRMTERAMVRQQSAGDAGVDS